MLRLSVFEEKKEFLRGKKEDEEAHLNEMERT